MLSVPESYSAQPKWQFGEFFGTGHIRLRTLVWLRWFAIIGQSATVLIVHFALGYHLPLWMCLAVISVSVVLNIFLVLKFPLTKLIYDREATAYLAFDILQLASLLFLTGGIQNPFSLLFLAPVTISASRLRLRNTLFLGLLAFTCVTILTISHEPLPWSQGSGLSLPLVYVLGLWIASLFGIGFTAMYVQRLAWEANHMSEALTATQMVLAQEQKLSALGSLAAVAAHELGTPLGTIQIVSKELLRQSPEDADLKEDFELLHSQAVRCREILSELVMRPEEEDEVYYRALLTSLLEESIARYKTSGAPISLLKSLNASGDEPKLWRSPEVIHGLGSFIENAADFSKDGVVIHYGWDAKDVWMQIYDDGPGFSSEILGRLGEPYVTTRSTDIRNANHAARRGERVGGGMGLGFFIAKTLLERSGGRVSFRNYHASDVPAEISDMGFQSGAVVGVMWPRETIDVESLAEDIGE